MPQCSMCLEKARDVKDRAGPLAMTPRLICDLCVPNTLAAVRARGADQAGRELLEDAYRAQDGNIVQIARVVGSDRTRVRAYLRRYGIGRYAKKGA